MSTPDPATRWQLYTVDETVEILGMARATLYRRTKGPNALPHHVVEGRGLCFTADDLDKIIDLTARGRR